MSDFGSAKQLKCNSISATYICSRYYRAPECILDRNMYSFEIDVWAFGCILAEIPLSVPIFQGGDNVSQLASIIKLLGLLAPEDVSAMPSSTSSSLDTTQFQYEKNRLTPKKWSHVLTHKLETGRVVNASYGDTFENLLTNTLRWNPKERLIAGEIISHSFFKDADEHDM